MDYPKIGDKVKISVEGTVIDCQSGHGYCVEVELPRKDFILDRRIWLNLDEIGLDEAEKINQKPSILEEWIDNK